MIRLEIDKWCHSCPEFKPDVEKTNLYTNDELSFVDTSIRCKHRDRCRFIASYLEKQNQIPTEISNA